MPINIPNPIPNVGSTNIALYPPIPYGTVNGAVLQQQGFGWVTTLINPFFVAASYPVTSSIGQFLYYGAIAPTTSAIDVSDYNNFAFSSYASGSGTSTIAVSSSIDGLNFVGEFLFSGTNSGSIFRPTVLGRRRYLMATFSGTGNTTGSLYLLSGQ
jgi:hypothetical protein